VILLGRGRTALSGYARRTRVAGVARRPTIAWCAAAGAVVAFELFALFSLPRRTHPTISSYIGSVTTHDPGKGLLFALWLLIGWWIGSGASLSSG
jgi:hypothetical protein